MKLCCVCPQISNFGFYFQFRKSINTSGQRNSVPLSPMPLTQTEGEDRFPACLQYIYFTVVTDRKKKCTAVHYFGGGVGEA